MNRDIICLLLIGCQLIELPNVAGESPSTPILSVLSNTLMNGLLSSYGALAHFLPLTPTNIPRNSHRGFFLPRISKYRKGDRFSTWHAARACLLSPIPARGKHNVGQCDHFELKIAQHTRAEEKEKNKNFPPTPELQSLFGGAWTIKQIFEKRSLHVLPTQRWIRSIISSS